MLPDWHYSSTEATCSREGGDRERANDIGGSCVFASLAVYTTAPQTSWNGCACGAACEVGVDVLLADELNRR